MRQSEKALVEWEMSIGRVESEVAERKWELSFPVLFDLSLSSFARVDSPFLLQAKSKVLLSVSYRQNNGLASLLLLTIPGYKGNANQIHTKIPHHSC
jgi:lipopolysaccharide assembly outer membrane protein LptD (OstA)